MNITPQGQTRTCIECRRVLPIEKFYSSGHGNGRRRTCIRCLQEEGARQRRRKSAPIRHTRYNARGHVWCNRCAKYLPPESFKRHPSRPHTFWSYCKPCVIQIDRDRYRKKVSTLEGATEVLEARYRRKQRQKREEIRERKSYCMHAIDQLRVRGFTVAEISRLTDIGHATLAKWADPRDKTRILEAGERRLEVVLRAALSMPRIGYQDRRRLPHPEFARIHALTHDEVQSYYLRNAWRKKNGERGRRA